MRTLIVYANPSPASLSSKVREVVEDELKKKGTDMVVRDLYAMNFNPVLTSADQLANREGHLPEDIKIEQEYVAWADVIIFIYPIWWTGLPAIMKGYIDRILLYGFAYKFGTEGLIKLLKGKRAVILNNHGLPKDLYDKGMYQALKMTSDEGICNFVGLEVVDHLFFPSSTSSSEEQKQEYLVKVRQLIAHL
jgi:NAD(P)H dehydrogenase (quinone)